MVVAGLEYVDLPLAMRAVTARRDVIAYDTDLVRAKRMEAGESYVEDVPADELAAALGSGQFCPSASEDAYTDFDVAVLTVPTPTSSHSELTITQTTLRMLLISPRSSGGQGSTVKFNA